MAANYLLPTRPSASPAADALGEYLSFNRITRQFLNGDDIVGNHHLLGDQRLSRPPIKCAVERWSRLAPCALQTVNRGILV